MISSKQPATGAHHTQKMNTRNLAGYALLVAGVAGCFLPLLPGIPLLIAGAAVLGWDHPLVRPWAKYLRRKQKPE
jgi:uncharacterized membrane protein YbaN (DUF454 family)